MSARNPVILVVAGLNKEAALAAGPGIRAIAGGGDAASLALRLEAEPPGAIGAIVSFGICGALAPDLAVGDVVVADQVRDAAGIVWPCSPAIMQRWRGGLAEPPRGGTLLGLDRPAMSAAEKGALHDSSGAVAVDMESHVAARHAAERKLPFAVLRVVSDGAADTLPPIAGRAMRPDGSIDLPGVLAGLARDPRQLGPLIATGRNAATAFRRLGGVRGLLGDLRGLLGLDLR